MKTSSIDPRTFRDVLGNYPTGVVVVTAKDLTDDPVAMVVGTFSSVSMDPALISFMPRKESKTFERLRETDHFTISVLAYDQVDLCSMLAKGDPKAFTNFTWGTSAGGNPTVDGALATIECRFNDILDAGDHHIVIGEVLELTAHRNAAPLIFFQGAYGGFAAPVNTVNSIFLAEAVATASRSADNLAKLARWLRAEVSVLARIGQDFYTVAGAADGDRIGQVGERYPMLPPLGELFVAWDPEESAAWIAKMGDSEIVPLLERRLARARDQKWAVAFSSEYRSTEVLRALESYGTPLLAPAAQREIEKTVKRAEAYYRDEELDAETIYAVQAIVVPVFGPDQQVDFVLRANCNGQELTGAMIVARADELSRASLRFAQDAKQGAYGRV